MANTRFASDRLGKIFISEWLLNSKQGLKDLEEIFSISGFIPIRIEDEPWKRGFLYYGLSHKFEEIELGEAPPEYIAEVKKTPNKFGSVDITGVKFIKLDF